MCGNICRSVLITIAGASVSTGAPAQTLGEDNLFGLIRVVNEKKVEKTDTVASELNVMFNDPCPLGVLDYVTGTYDSIDFYESGYWGEPFTSDIYIGSLPEYNDGDFILPAHGILTSMFGYREAFHRTHKGVDIAVKIGDPIVAALPGVVKRIGYDPMGYGHFIIIVHNGGVETRYAHLSCVTTSLGQKIAAGDIIGKGGNTGNSTGPHLHFEVRKQGKAIDPLLIFHDLANSHCQE